MADLHVLPSKTPEPDPIAVEMAKKFLAACKNGIVEEFVITYVRAGDRGMGFFSSHSHLEHASRLVGGLTVLAHHLSEKVMTTMSPHTDDELTPPSEPADSRPGEPQDT